MADTADKAALEPIRIGVGDLGSGLAGYLRQVRNGRYFLITAPDGDLAELRPPTGVEPRRRVPGTLRGKIRISVDFDTWPDDVLDAMDRDPFDDLLIAQGINENATFVSNDSNAPKSPHQILA